ncbi:MAG: hypothetical protein ABIP35_01445, partial [Ginsengibacter sp.]
MEFIDKYIGGVFLSRRFYISLAGSIALFLLAYFIPLLTILPFVFLFALIVFFIGEYFMLFFTKRLPLVKRIIADRLSLAE